MDYLSGYQVVEHIDKSDTDEVLFALKKDSGTPYILKIVLQNQYFEKTGFNKKRIYKEVDIVASFDHPNIVKPADVVFERDKVIVVYPYYDGKTLSGILADSITLDEAKALNITRQLLEALIYVHNRGIIHADINPNNIFITEDKGLKLLDFGYSLADDDAKKIPEGNIVGTFPFLSPEQMGFTRFKIDNRSDLYCVGIILYRMLGGKLPFCMPNNNIKELLDAALKRDIEILKTISKNINGVLIKGLRPSPVDRYQTGEGFLYDVNQCIEMMNGSLANELVIGEMDALYVVNRKRLFIVREREIEKLVDGLRKVDNQKGRYYLLFGKSGIGKTEIVREFKTRIDPDRYDFLSAKCNRFTPALPYSVIKQLFDDLSIRLELAAKEETADFLESIREAVADFSGVICSVVPALKAWFKTVSSIDRIEKEKETDRIIHVMGILFGKICLKRKIVIFVDDFQWIDKITYKILRRMIDDSVPCLIICNYRTRTENDDLFYYSDDLRAAGFSCLLKVNPFTKGETQLLIDKKFNGLSKCGTLADVLFQKTDGVPFVEIEAIKYLVSKNYLYMSGNEWVFRDEGVEHLPEKFDLLSLLIDTTKTLLPEEKNTLETASLIEGKFDVELITEITGMTRDDAVVTLMTLENNGFFKAQIKGGYAFIHDKIQESIAGKIPAEQKIIINEKIGHYFLNLAEKEKENLFSAAEYFLKSKNYPAAINVCYGAALYATEKNALDVAIKYYKNTLVIYTFAKKEGVKSDKDIVKITMEFGKVLMLTGLNTQALNTFRNLIEKMNLTTIQRMESQYFIGAIYHNLGEFEKSIPCFVELLQSMGVKIPQNRKLLFPAIGWEVAIQVVFSLGFKKIVRKRKDTFSLIKARALFKLAYSLYFSDMKPCFLVHFKSLNLADTLDNCFEKSEIYASHQVPVYQMMFKKRAFKYLQKSIDIASKINRMDNLAFAQSFGGLAYYYHAEWSKSSELLSNSIKVYASIGDLNNQLLSAEHLWKIKLIKGNMDDAYEAMQKMIELCRKVNEQSYLIITFAALELIQFLRTGKCETVQIEEIEKRLKTVNLNHLSIEAGEYLLNLEIEMGEFKKAYNRALMLLPLILKKCINSEYQVRGFSLFCGLICTELRNRLKDNKQIQVSSTKLKIKFLNSCFAHFFSCLNYPAYWGALFRNSAWFFALHKQKWAAHFCFKRAIRFHHNLDMRFEEACSIRDYGLFLDEFCNLPGKARDQFSLAYDIFCWCGSKLESERLVKYVCKEKLSGHSLQADIAYAATAATSGSASTGINQLRFETLVDVSKTITETDDPGILLRQILSAMITVTGAQYGCLFINKNAYEQFEPIAMSFEGNEVVVSDVPVFRDLIDKVNEIHTLQCAGEDDLDDDNETDSAYIRSDLCVPLNWRDKYLGYVYLVNDRVRGLFGEGAQKAAMILAAHAGILLENAALMGRQKQFTIELQNQVDTQTADIKYKHEQLEAANLKLIESERMKGILSGTLVHDIKNYAAGITGNLIYLDRRLENDPKAHRIIDVVVETCSDITSLASNLLDIAKMDDGKMIVREELLDFEFFEAMAEKFGKSTLFEEKGIIPTIIAPDPGFYVYADIYLLERVLQNLYSNASKYAPKGSSVELRLYQEGEECIVCFYNSGTPIPDSEKVVLFEKYARIQSRQSPYSKGLGLFFCRMVMNAHGGRIWLDTDSRGNYFKLAFPDKQQFRRLSAAS